MRQVRQEANADVSDLHHKSNTADGDYNDIGVVPVVVKMGNVALVYPVEKRTRERGAHFGFVDVDNVVGLTVPDKMGPS